MKPQADPPTVEDTISRLERAVSTFRWVLWLGALVVGAMLVYLAWLQIQVSSVNGQLDHIKTQVDKVGDFVDDLQEERATADAISAEELRQVFGHITDTLSLLCNEYPDDPICLQG